MTNSPHLRADGGEPPLFFLEAFGDARVNHEEFFVLHRAEAVEDHGHPALVTVLTAHWLFGRDRVEQQVGHLRGAAERAVADSGLAVDAESLAHPALLDMEQRLIGTRQGAALEGQTERPCRVVGFPRHALGLVEIRACFDGRTRDLEDR